LVLLVPALTCTDQERTVIVSHLLRFGNSQVNTEIFVRVLIPIHSEYE